MRISDDIPEEIMNYVKDHIVSIEDLISKKNTENTEDVNNKSQKNVML